jgi:hypothetical protein
MSSDRRSAFSSVVVHVDKQEGEGGGCVEVQGGTSQEGPCVRFLHSVRIRVDAGGGELAVATRAAGRRRTHSLLLQVLWGHDEEQAQLRASPKVKRVPRLLCPAE